MIIFYNDGNILIYTCSNSISAINGKHNTKVIHEIFGNWIMPTAYNKVFWKIELLSKKAKKNHAANDTTHITLML